LGYSRGNGWRELILRLDLALDDPCGAHFLGNNMYSGARGEADKRCIKSGVCGREPGGRDGSQQLLGEMPDFGRVEPWIDGIHQWGW
jgi:hypothetical protein